jgi:predicted DCC family thiol-disulfide oxidoreductase YuxK
VIVAPPLTECPRLGIVPGSVNGESVGIGSRGGWTGGQYSLVRACAGAALAARFAAHAVGSGGSELVLHMTGAFASVLLAVGFHERTAAYVLAPTLIAAGFAGGEGAPGQVHWLALAVLLHLSTPEAPYGSLDARGRVDPGGGWRMGRGTIVAARLSLLGVLATFAFSRSEPYLALVWFAALSFDPRWIAPLPAAGPEHLFYDGTCGLCHRFVRFVLAETELGEGEAGAEIRFAPLQGRTFESIVGAGARATLPDSVVVRTADGGVLVRSQASRHVLARLGGLWRALSALLAVVPRGVADAVYDGIARVRHRLFRRPSEACPLLPPRLARRFDP